MALKTMMTIALLLSASSAAWARTSSEIQNAPAMENPAPLTVGAPLWRGFTAGLDANAVVEQLQKFPEISEAKLKIRKGRFPEIKLKFNSRFSLFGFQFEPNFIFNEGGLNSINLSSASVCEGERFQNSLNNLVAGLSEKYPKRLTIVNDLGSEVKNQTGFTDDFTQVIMTISYFQPPSAYEVARAKLDASLASAEKRYDAFSKNLNASMMELRRNNAISSCPSVDGNTRSIILTYRSRSESIRNQMQSEKIKEEKQERDIDGI